MNEARYRCANRAFRPGNHSAPRARSPIRPSRLPDRPPLSAPDSQMRHPSAPDSLPPFPAPCLCSPAPAPCTGDRDAGIRSPSPTLQNCPSGPREWIRGPPRLERPPGVRSTPRRTPQDHSIGGGTRRGHSRRERRTPGPPHRGRPRDCARDCARGIGRIPTGLGARFAQRDSGGLMSTPVGTASSPKNAERQHCADGMHALSAAEAPSESTEEAVIQFPIERQPKGR